jgi:hypothetical protein
MHRGVPSVLSLPCDVRPTSPFLVSCIAGNMSCCASCSYYSVQHFINRQLHSVLCSIVYSVFSNMVENIQHIISEYQQRLVEMPYVPERSYRHSVVGINHCEHGFPHIPIQWQGAGYPVSKGCGVDSQCNVIAAVVIWPGTLIHQLLMVLAIWHFHIKVFTHLLLIPSQQNME